ncbi:hypothetical protein [Candidatus Formimonas warabiya]|uniref:Uncharacterized protein n=1 Tax=Formimonas warabiya TaxID=1761012 RepID=A0A3G1KZA1_FORW1|nr:hypothetical protein [Candidatus Formimonas warabiya]ATW27709.1 hypothetical protein DCMF_25780 [Candidatus Formimonas warabiya]
MSDPQDAVALSDCFEIESDDTVEANIWPDFIKDMLEGILSRIAPEGRLLGHIKASVFVKNDLIFGSTTGGPITIRVVPDPMESKATLLKIALIAYKIERDYLQKGFQETVREICLKYGFKYRVKPHEHHEPHAHDHHHH